jgi:hypothetical protein
MIPDPAVPKSAALRALYWRSEILQLLCWLRGEGLGDLVDADLLERFLGVDGGTAIGHLDCSADCWCHVSTEEAAVCAAERGGE